MTLSFIKKIDKTRQQNKCIHCRLQECVKLGRKRGQGKLKKRFHSVVHAYIHVHTYTYNFLYFLFEAKFYTNLKMK